MDINADKKILTQNQTNSTMKTHFSSDSNFLDEINELKDTISAENLPETAPETEVQEQPQVDSLLNSVVNEFQLKSSNNFKIIKKEEPKAVQNEQKSVQDELKTVPNEPKTIQDVQNTVPNEPKTIQNEPHAAKNEPKIINNIPETDIEQNIIKNETEEKPVNAEIISAGEQLRLDFTETAEITEETEPVNKEIPVLQTTHTTENEIKAETPKNIVIPEQSEPEVIKAEIPTVQKEISDETVKEHEEIIINDKTEAVIVQEKPAISPEPVKPEAVVVSKEQTIQPEPMKPEAAIQQAQEPVSEDIPIIDKIAAETEPLPDIKPETRISEEKQVTEAIIPSQGNLPKISEPTKAEAKSEIIKNETINEVKPVIKENTEKVTIADEIQPKEITVNTNKIEEITSIIEQNTSNLNNTKEAEILIPENTAKEKITVQTTEINQVLESKPEVVLPEIKVQTDIIPEVSKIKPQAEILPEVSEIKTEITLPKTTESKISDGQPETVKQTKIAEPEITEPNKNELHAEEPVLVNIKPVIDEVIPEKSEPVLAETVKPVINQESPIKAETEEITIPKHEQNIQKDYVPQQHAETKSEIQNKIEPVNEVITESAQEVKVVQPASAELQNVAKDEPKLEIKKDVITVTPKAEKTVSEVAVESEKNVINNIETNISKPEVIPVQEPVIPLKNDVTEDVVYTEITDTEEIEKPEKIIKDKPEANILQKEDNQPNQVNMTVKPADKRTEKEEPVSENNIINTQPIKEEIKPQIQTNLSFGTGQESFESVLGKTNEIKESDKELEEDLAILSTDEENLAIAAANNVQIQPVSGEIQVTNQNLKLASGVDPMSQLIADTNRQMQISRKILQRGETKTNFKPNNEVTYSEVVTEVEEVVSDNKTTPEVIKETHVEQKTVTKEKVVKVKPEVMPQKDINFMLSLTKTDSINLADTLLNQAQETAQNSDISNKLIELIKKAMSENKPLRLDFDNKISVIIKISKEGKISADFIPGDKAVENYLRNNIPLLKQQFEAQNIKYDDITHQNSKQQKDKENTKNKKEQKNE